MSNIVEMSKTEIRLLSVDFDSHESTQDALTKLGGLVVSKTAEAARAKYPLAVAAERMVSVHGMSAGNVATAAGLSEGVISKVRQIARLAVYATSARSDESPYSTAMEDQVARLQRYWDLENNGKDSGSLANALLALVGDDGEHRADVGVAGLYGTFGATENFYNVAKGNRVHPDDEIVPDDDEQGDDEQGDDEPTSGLDMISQAIGVARSQGVSDADIAAHVMRVLSV